jgi:hypothetical protein
MSQTIFIAVWIRHPELPLFKRTLKINRIEREIMAESIKEAFKIARRKPHKGFILTGLNYK